MTKDETAPVRSGNSREIDRIRAKAAGTYQNLVAHIKETASLPSKTEALTMNKASFVVDVGHKRWKNVV